MIIFKYIFKEFLKIFLIMLLSLIILFWIGDFFASLNTLLKSDASISIIVKYFVFRIPVALYYLIPFAVLFSTIYLFKKLNQHYEVIAFRTLRIKKTFLYKIFFCLGIISYLLLFFNNEILIPKGYYYSKILKNVYIKRKFNYAVFKADKIWYKKKNYFLKIDFADFENGFLRGITVFKFNKQFKLINRIDAPLGFFIDNKWELIDVESIKFLPDMSTDIKKIKSLILPIKIVKADFFAITSDPSFLNIVQVYKIISNLKSTSINTVKYKTNLLNKLVYPFTPLIFIFYGFIICLRNPREKGASIIVLLGIIFGFGFLFIHNIFISLGTHKIIPYFISPFLSFLISISGFLLLSRKIKY